MVDIDLLAEQLRTKGHDVSSVLKVPENAGEYEITVDGEVLTLEEARAILASEQE